MVFVRKVEVIEGDGNTPGSRDRRVFKLGPRAQTIETESIEHRTNEASARRTVSGPHMQCRMTFNPEESRTRVRWTIDYKPPMGPLGALADAVFMNRVFQNEVEESLERLKASLER